MAEPDPIEPSPSAHAARPRPPRRRSTWLRLALGLAAVAGALLAARQLGGVVGEGVRRVSQLGAWAPVVFVLGYAIATVCLAPGLILTLAGGAIFGLVRGTAYVFAGAVLGSSLAFLIARYVARAAVERRLAGNARFAAVDRAIGREGRKVTFLLRLSPLFPFNLLNYALGLTRVRFRDYLIASLGMLPGTILYVYGGKVIGDVAAVASGARPSGGPGAWALLALGLVATAAATAVVTRSAKRALAEEVEHVGP
jgi:uncharacterized membrane protein YdjX (TVP38/TMEM64 family)